MNPPGLSAQTRTKARPQPIPPDLRVGETLQQRAQVTSTCPTTGTTIRLTVDPDRGVVDADPPSTVLSFLRPDRPFDEDVVVSFCHDVHFFASPDAARDWTEEHPGTSVLDLDEGFRLGLAHPVHHPAVPQMPTRPAPEGVTP